MRSWASLIQDFGVAQASVFERSAFEPNLRSEFGSHLADGARKAPCPQSVIA